MSRTRSIAVMLSAGLGLICSMELARADPIGRYECNVVGNGNPEPIGDRAKHALVSMQYICRGVDGLLKGAVYTALSVAEWDGPNGTFLLAGGTHRMAGGVAVTQLTEGKVAVVMKDDKPVGMTSTGTAQVKFAAGSLAALAGKPFRFATRQTGFNQFELVMEE